LRSGFSIYLSGKIFLNHPVTVVGSLSGTSRIELAVALDGDLILMYGSDAWNRGRQGIKAPSQGNDPSIATQVVERLPKVGILESNLRGQFSGPLR
jgi:hypothetical protein